MILSVLTSPSRPYFDERVGRAWCRGTNGAVGPRRAQAIGSPPMQLAPHYPVTTARLRLRPLSLADVDGLVAYRSRLDVCRYVPFEPMDEAAVVARLSDRWANHAITSDCDRLTLGVEIAATGAIVGDVMLRLVSETDRCGEVGWVFNPDHTGHGYATEAAHALLHMGFDDLGLHRMIARVDVRNSRSLRLGDRLAMRREANLIENEWFKGAWSSEIDFALLESEWTRQHATTPAMCARPRIATLGNSPERSS